SIDFKGSDFKALAYEYMQNGSLEDCFHQSTESADQLQVMSLRLIQRLHIAIEVASAIQYLHCLCQTPIVHGEVKPSNILLDQDMVAHVSDSGLAKFLYEIPLSNSSQNLITSSGIRGTVGLLQKYGMGSKPSIPGDVYSFGMLLLEMIRKRPTDAMFRDGVTLHNL
ncbi:LOW QUALITY PROTEIN: Pkinase_Tyr domain-containing protein, partial [Cephalotus follicularis]